MKFVLILSSLMILLPVSHAAAVLIEPDDFSPGDVLDNVSSFVELSIEAPGIGGLQPTPFDVTATAGDNAILDASPTGDLVFAHANIPFFPEIRVLRGDFAGVTDAVSVLFSPGSTLVPYIGRLEVYDASGTLLAFDETPALIANSSSLTFDTLTVTRPTPDIAFFRAYTIEGEFGRFDALSFSTPVPEPASATLLGVVGLFVLRRRRR
ncbi:MAG: PEP-CTERM sorting domain-containing protein [Planctomycetota bacterium]